MTAEQPPVEAAGERPSSRAAVGCLAIIGASFAGTIVVAVPETGYFVAGLLAAATVRKARGWAAGRRQTAEERPEPADVIDVVATLHELSPGGTLNVRLTQLADAAQLISTQTIRELLDEAGIPVRTGVRAGGRNGPGVHATDIPRSCDTPSDDCWCRSASQPTANNTGGEDPGEGFRVEAIGQAGTVVHDPTETQRRRGAVAR